MKKTKQWYKVIVQYDNHCECYEVCEVDVLAAVRAVKKSYISEDKYIIEEVLLYR